MSRRLLRDAMALAALVCAPAAAQAQDVPEVISPLRIESDNNGVNLVSGKAMMQGPSLTAPGAPNLKFDRVQNAAPYVKGVITGAPGQYVEGTYTIHTGGGTEAIRCEYDDVCTSVTGTGSSFLVNVNTFTQGGSGAVWQFSLKHENTTNSNPNRIRYYASSVTYPNGEVISYTYNTATLPGDTFGRIWYRPTQITSSLGYSITITYQYAGSDIGNPYWGSPSVVTLWNLSQPATPIGRLTYSGSTVTDLNGRVYSCSGCSNALGADLETTSGTLQMPGEASPAMQVTPHPGGQVVGSVVKDGVSWTYSYVNLRLGNGGTAYVYDKLTVDGPNGFRNVYDMSGSNIRNVIIRSTDSISRATNYSIDPAYRPTQIVSPEGNKVNVSYDNYGNIVSRTTTPKAGSGLAPVTETALYPTDDWNLCNGQMSQPRCYRPLWSRDGLGRQTDYVWNDRGQLIEQTDPPDEAGVRRKTFITYETGTLSRKSVVRVCGTGSACGTTNEVRTEYTYWGNTFLPSRERRIDAARGITLDTLFNYDAAGRLLSTDGPLPDGHDAVHIRYDIHGRKSWEIGPQMADGRRSAKRMIYRDSDDHPIATEEGTVPDASSSDLSLVTRTDIAYDSRRNAIRETISNASGTVIGVLQRSFDDRRRQECEAQRMNPAAFGSLPSSACALGPTGSQGPDRITRKTYDAAGQLTVVQRAYGVTIANGFPATLQQEYARYEYTPNGKQKAVIDANGNRAEMVYDGFDRQRRWIFPSPSIPVTGSVNPNDYEEYGYDPVGNRTSVRKRDGVTLTFQFDQLNRITQKNVPTSASGAAGYSVFYAYDVRGLQTHARFSSATGPGITTAYDGFGRPLSSANTMGGFSRTIGYGYDAGGRRTSLTHPDGAYGAYEYDSSGRLLRIRENGGTIIASFGYDSIGRPESVGFAGATTSYGYDPLSSRLNSIGHDLAGTVNDQGYTFAYNHASQITTKTAANDLYAWTGHYNIARGYAVNGLNQYTGTTSDGVPSATFLYDGNANLRSDGATNFVYDAENRLVSASGAKTAAIVYDPLGRLFQVTSGAGAVTQFLYDGDELIQEYDGAGTLLRRFVHGNGSDDPLLWYEGAGGDLRRSLLTDHQGSIVAVADLAGNKFAINSYDPWGIPGTGNIGRFQYTGQAWIAELGMYYFKARFYSPTLGRFMQTDPIGYDDQVNLYAYVGNDPVSGTDPTGMAGCDTGTRLSYNTAFCQVADGYNGIADKVEGARQGRKWVHIRDPNSEEGIFIQLMLNDPDVARSIELAWKYSRGDRGPTNQKNEYGFWVKWSGGSNFKAGVVFRGNGSFIDRQSIARAREALPGAQIFIHVHPFRGDGKELTFVESIGISGLEEGGGDAGVALSFKSMVVSIARPEPYNGKGAYVDWVDFYWRRDRR